MKPVEPTLKRVRSKRVEIRGKTYLIRRWIWQMSDAGDSLGVSHDCQVWGKMGKTLCWVDIPDFERDKALHEAAWGEWT